MLANLKTLFLADMGPIPLTILSPFGQLRSLNLSGNHLINISLSILDPANNLEVNIIWISSWHNIFPYSFRLSLSTWKNKCQCHMNVCILYWVSCHVSSLHTIMYYTLYMYGVCCMLYVDLLSRTFTNNTHLTYSACRQTQWDCKLLLKNPNKILGNRFLLILIHTFSRTFITAKIHTHIHIVIGFVTKPTEWLWWRLCHQVAENKRC